MIINEPLEAYTMSLGFFLNNRIWDLMLMTGVAYIPILLTVVGAVAKAYQGGDDEGDRGSVALRAIEVGLIRIFFVMIFVLIPNGDKFHSSSVAYSKYSCLSQDLSDTTSMLNHGSSLISDLPTLVTRDGEVINNGVDFQEHGMGLQVNGLSPTPPLLIEFVQNYSSKTVNSLSASMPCEADVSTLALSIGEIQVKNQDTGRLLNTVVKQCYLPILEREMGKMTFKKEDLHDNYWIGAPFFTGASSINGKYEQRKMSLSPEYWLKTLQTIDGAGVNIDRQLNIVDDGKVSPSCKDGYKTLEKYIKRDYRHEIKEMDSDFLDGVWVNVKNMYNEAVGDALSPTRGLDTIIKRLTFATTHQEKDEFRTTKDMIGSLYNDSEDKMSAAALTFSWMGAAIDASFAKSLAAPTLAIVQMLVFIVSPILLLLSNYSMKAVGMICVTIFGLEFTHFIIEVCIWVDNTLMLMSSSSYSLIDMNSSRARGAIYTAVNMSYYILPITWMTLLGSVGFGASSLGQVMGSSAKSASAQGVKGSSSVAGGVKGQAIKAGSK